MKSGYYLFLAMTLFFSCREIVSGQKLYISPQGSDTNSGTADKPLATLNAAALRAREMRKEVVSDEPFEIIVSGGEYFMMQPLVLTMDDSGTPYSPLVFKSAPDGRAIFRGGVPVTGFEKVTEKLWRTFIPQVAWYDSYFEQLYVNGRRAVRAKSPNDGFYRVKNVTETVIEKGIGRAPEIAVQKIELDSLNAECIRSFSEQDFEDALIIFYHNWDNSRKRITGFSRESSSVFTAGEGMKPWNPINSKSRYLVENFKAGLDAPGEWFLERSGYLYYIPLENEKIENSTFYIPVIREFVSIQGDPSSGKRVENIRFENVVFETAGYKTPVHGNEPAQAAAPVGAVITLDFAENIEFRNCEIAHTGTCRKI